MHPWFNRRVKHDVGAFLYRHVHSVHHKSYNPGPWSGLAMHPVEHLIYFTRSFVMLAFGVHPAFFYMANVRSLLGPAPGHHGFASVMGSEFHYLHHAHFECNFGTSRVVPIDNVLGTYLVTAGAAKKHTSKCGLQFLQPDRSVVALIWLTGLPYLGPLWAL